MKWVVISLISLTGLVSCVKTDVLAEYLPYDFKVEGIAYNIISENNLTVAVTGAEKPSSYKGNIVIPSTVVYDDKTYTVTQLAYQCFLESDLNSITIPESISYIIDSAFEGSQIKNLIIDDSNKSIAINKSLNYATIESAYIGRSISGNWISTSLDNLTLGKEVTKFSIQLTQPLTITLESEIPPIGDIEATDEIFDNSIIYVPPTAIRTYEDSDNWSKFKIILAAE